MAIETKCPGCSRTLRVGDEHAGKPARCPMCHEIYTVPGEPLAAAASAAGESPATWRMRTPEGHVYGPVGQQELDRWVAEGRVAHDCELMSDLDAQWRAADVYYPALAPVSVSSTPRAAVNVPRYLAPHRGGLVLALGIISWAVGCPIFGICAWVMGSADLREMRAGRMDPSGQGLTQAGQIIGMIHALLTILAIVLFVFAMLVFGLS